MCSSLLTESGLYKKSQLRVKGLALFFLVENVFIFPKNIYSLSIKSLQLCATFFLTKNLIMSNKINLLFAFLLLATLTFNSSCTSMKRNIAMKRSANFFEKVEPNPITRTPQEVFINRVRFLP